MNIDKGACLGIFPFLGGKSMFENIMEDIVRQKPLVHCMTNRVTMNDCANVILAVHGRPIMADDENEVEDITTGCQSLVMNVGTLQAATIPAFIKAGKKANVLKHPIVLDPVGVGASQWRFQVVSELLNQVQMSVIKGNISELKALALGVHTMSGVDVNVHDLIDENHLDETISFLRELSIKLKTIIVMTGKIDIVTDGKESYLIRNGCAEMARITGTGCMLSALIGTYVGVNHNLLEAVVCAVSLMGYSGELAYQRICQEKRGTGSMRVYLIDYLSQMTYAQWKEGMKIEKRSTKVVLSDR